MKYYSIIFIATVLITACTQPSKYYLYEFGDYDISSEMLNKHLVQVNDTSQIKLLNDILNTEHNNPDLEYYYQEDLKDPYIVVKVDDYFVREYAIWNDKTYVELSYKGGDGPASYKRYSYTSNDSLITYNTSIIYLEDERADTTLNEYIVDTTINVVLLNGKKLHNPNKLRLIQQ